jgi:hypothetical protein
LPQFAHSCGYVNVLLLSFPNFFPLHLSFAGDTLELKQDIARRLEPTMFPPLFYCQITISRSSHSQHMYPGSTPELENAHFFPETQEIYGVKALTRDLIALLKDDVTRISLMLLIPS